METRKYDIKLLFGTLCIWLISEVPLILTDEIKEFCTDQSEAKISVYIKLLKSDLKIWGERCGEDLLLEYYRYDQHLIAAAKRGTKDSAAVTVYTPDFSEAIFYINDRGFPGMIRRVSKILQLFPMRRALAEYHALLLHSSRILIRGKAIIFTAPSRTGKTTQAQLWNQYEKAEIVSNDRTLIQQEQDTFYTYGYPVDGSSPVYSSRKLPLGAIVVLKQGEENRTEKLPAGKALKYLMEQTVADIWDGEEMQILQELWVCLLRQYPVYQLTATPDERAVFCLKEQLIRDEVI